MSVVISRREEPLRSATECDESDTSTGTHLRLAAMSVLLREPCVAFFGALDRRIHRDKKAANMTANPSVSSTVTTLSDWAARDLRCLWHPFTQQAEWQPLVIVAGDGNHLIDEHGQRYLDGVSSLWANLHGHRHPRLNQAIAKQLDQLAHSTLLGLSHPSSIELGERLVALAPPGLSRVFYSDSGSTSVEVALKMAFQFHQHGGDTKRQRFLALHNAYHGDTLGSVSVGGIDLFHRLFAPLLFHTERVDPSLPALEAAFASHGSALAAFVVEPLVQGAAGMLLQPPGFLRRARELCDQHGVLLIADEVATGFGRTGTMFACEQVGVAPDFLCVAKGLSGGYLPLAATLTTEPIYQRFLGRRSDLKTFFHGHTFTGNPLGCAAAIASLQVFEEEQVLATLPSKIATLRDALSTELGSHRHVREVRQCGLMVGIELGQDRSQSFPSELAIGARVCEQVRRHGVILRPLGDVVVLLPPLSITHEELLQLVLATRRALDEVLASLPSSDGQTP